MKGYEMRLQNIVPVLDVRDVDASIEFYKTALGFSVSDKVAWGGQTEWALLRCGQVQLMLCASKDSVGDDESLQSDNVFFIYIEDMDALELQLNNSADSVRRSRRRSRQKPRFLCTRSRWLYALVQPATTRL